MENFKNAAIRSEFRAVIKCMGAAFYRPDIKNS